jgi:2-hydroxy-6-oxonona-2,4-dienedioate hydrolase
VKSDAATRSQWVSRWSTVNGHRVHARASTTRVPGDRVPVILVHGQVVSSRYMIPTLERLGVHHPVHAIDFPGYGRSGKPDRTLTLPELADVLAEWLRVNDVPEAAFLGNSFGCQILAEFATRHPERVHALILQGPTADPEARSAIGQATRWLKNSREEPLSLSLILLKDYADAGFKRAVGTYRFLLADAIEEKLPRVTAPTLVVRGGLDPIVPERWAVEATRLLPRGRLSVIPGVPHTVNYDAPLELTRVTRAFLRDVAEGDVKAKPGLQAPSWRKPK